MKLQIYLKAIPNLAPEVYSYIIVHCEIRCLEGTNIEYAVPKSIEK
jgi:hypothetical protein